MSSNFTVQAAPRQKRENLLQRILRDPDSRDLLKKVLIGLALFAALILFNLFVDSSKLGLLTDAKGQDYYAIEVLQHGIMPHLQTGADGTMAEAGFGDPALPLLGEPVKLQLPEDPTVVYRLRIKTRPDDQAPWQYADADVILVEEPTPALREAGYEYRGRLLAVTWKNRVLPLIDKDWLPDLCDSLMWKQ